VLSGECLSRMAMLSCVEDMEDMEDEVAGSEAVDEVVA
jgi:hypothetical protein